MLLLLKIPKTKNQQPNGLKRAKLMLGYLGLLRSGSEYSEKNAEQSLLFKFKKKNLLPIFFLNCTTKLLFTHINKCILT